jgi:hypothetical protein
LQQKKLKIIFSTIKQSIHKKVIIQQVQNQENILSQLNINKDCSSMYKVPVNYFVSLPQLIVLKAKKTEPVYTVPSNYFETVSSSILNSINNNEIENELLIIAPTLNKVTKQNVYSIPQNYFSNSLPNVSAAKVVKFNSFKWLKYASAATIIGFLCFWGVNKVNENNKIADLHQKAIQHNVAETLQSLSDDELSKHFEPLRVTNFIDDQLESSIPFSENIETELQYLPEDEVENYFKQRS